jgi:hypothetical protein
MEHEEVESGIGESIIIDNVVLREVRCLSGDDEGYEFLY